MIEEESAHRIVLPRPLHPFEGKVELSPEKSGALSGKPVGDRLRASSVVAVNLSPWTIEVAVVVEELEPAQDLLGASADEGGNLRGAEESVLGKRA